MTCACADEDDRPLCAECDRAYREARQEALERDGAVDPCAACHEDGYHVGALPPEACPECRPVRRYRGHMLLEGERVSVGLAETAALWGALDRAGHTFGYRSLGDGLYAYWTDAPEGTVERALAAVPELVAAIRRAS